MKTLVITPGNEKDLKFLRALLDKLGYSAEELTEEEIEDLALLKAMVKEKKENMLRKRQSKML